MGDLDLRLSDTGIVGIQQNNFVFGILSSGLPLFL